VIPGAAIFVGLPLVAAVLAYPVRRWRFIAIPLAMATVGLLALVLVWLPYAPTGRFLGLGVDPGGPVVALGRSLTLETDDRSALLFMYLASFFLFGAGLAVPLARLFVPAALIALGMLAAALFVQPFVFATAFLEAAAILTVVMLTDPQAGRPAPRGALRFLVFVTFSLPFILLTGWLLELYSGSPDDLTLLGRATVLLAAGFAILLAAVPFHSWIPAVAEQAPPPAAAFVFTVVQAAITFFMLEFLNQFDWLAANEQVFALMRLAGVIMVGLGGAFALAQRSFGRLMGYAVVADYGVMLLALGHGSDDGLRVGVTLIGLRGMALAVWGLGMGLLRGLRPAARDDAFERMRGLGREAPLASAAVILGGLSLVGFPLTAGFPGRWALWQLIAADYPQATWIVLLAALGVGVTYARGLAALVSRAEPEMEVEESAAPVFVEPAGETVVELDEAEALAAEEGATRPAPVPAWLSISLLGIGLTVLLALGIYPQWLLPAIANAAQAFARLPGS
jgi:formate hydrogenlyase subunit 3/multisubunit Na+/H+ antiporter MnhD subunit